MYHIEFKMCVVTGNGSRVVVIHQIFLKVININLQTSYKFFLISTSLNKFFANTSAPVVAERFWAQIPVTLVDLAVRIFQWFSPKLT